MPLIGEKVYVRPAPHLCPKGKAQSLVLASAETGRFLPVEGEEAIWSRHLAERHKHGEIVLFPQTANVAPVSVAVLSSPVKE